MIETDAILLKANELKIKRQPFALVTVVRCESPTSAKPGAKALVFENGDIQGWIGGGCAQPAVIDTVKKALRDGQGRLIRVSPDKEMLVDDGIISFGMNCLSGGTLDIFIDPVIPKPALLIIGAAPSAQALSMLAHRTGFEVTGMFPGANEELYPDAIQIIDGLDVSELNNKPTFVIVATQGKKDGEGLKAALAIDSNHIGFIASKRKAKKVKISLIENGHDKNKVDSILSPIGLDIGAITPEEIALSVLAELVKANREMAKSASIADEALATEAPSCCESMEKGSSV